MGLALVRRRQLLLAPALAAVAGACTTANDPDRGDTVPPTTGDAAPERFTIIPDDYHVPYAGTAGDGRRFFLSDELFGGGSSYVGLYLWTADGTFDEVRVDAVGRPDGLPPGQAAPADPGGLVETRLAELGDYVIEPITVEPFLTKVDGVPFGWRLQQYDGEYTLTIEPGDFIAYYAPWDGEGYDT